MFSFNIETKQGQIVFFISTLTNLNFMKQLPRYFTTFFFLLTKESEL